MRLTLLATVVAGALLAGCAQETPGTPPPNDRFYYPTGVALVPGADGGPGFLYVASSNFDLRFNRGTLAAVDLASLPLPASAPSVPATIDAAHIASQVKIDVFAGPLGVYQPAGAPATMRRLFVAGRQNNTLDAVDVDGATLKCTLDASTDDCAASAVNLGDALSDAWRPTVVGDNVFVSHLSPLDNPKGSGKARVSSLARISATDLKTRVVLPLGAADSDIGTEPVSAMQAIGDYLFLGGRAVLNANTAPMRYVRLPVFDAFAQSNTVVEGAGKVLLDPEIDLRDVRSMALSSDKSRLFVITRAPDALAVLQVAPDFSGFPRFTVAGVADLPSGASEMAVISRGPGRRDLVAVTCQTTNVVALYDDELGREVAELRGVGEQPFGIAAGPRPGGGARLYATAFGRGTFSVIDLPDLDNAASASVLANVGPNENCLSDNVDARPPECPK